MNIRAGVIEKLQVEQYHERTVAERVEEKAYPDRMEEGTDEDQNCQGRQMR